MIPDDLNRYIEEIEGTYAKTEKPHTSSISIIRQLCQAIYLNDYKKIKTTIEMNNISINYKDSEWSIDGISFKPIFYTQESFQRIFDAVCCKRKNVSTYPGTNLCHYLTKSMLKPSNKHLYAITSLCISDITNQYFYHSYIYNTIDNRIYDYANNFSMLKSNYDNLYHPQELNKVDYYECESQLEQINYNEWYATHQELLILAINKQNPNKSYQKIK